MVRFTLKYHCRKLWPKDLIFHRFLQQHFTGLSSTIFLSVVYVDLVYWHTCHQYFFIAFRLNVSAITSLICAELSPL